jgi:MATE family multidrug resistance protein
MIKKFFKNDVTSLLTLALPMVFMGVIQSGVMFFDTIFLAHLGVKVLAAGALVNWLFGTFIVVLLGSLSAINILVANKFGEENHHAIAQVFREGLWLALCIMPFAFLLFWFIGPIFGWFGQSPETIQLATSYLHALAFATIAWFPMMVCFELIMGIGDMRVMMAGNVVMVLLNILFSYLFIFGKIGLPSLGIAGAGYGMAVSYTITFIGLLIFLINQSKYKPYFKSLFTFEKPEFLIELLKTGIPIGVMYCFELAFFLALTLFMGAYNPELLVPNQITLQYGCLILTAAFAIAQAVTIRMGHLLGAKEVSSAKKANDAGVFLTLLVMGISALVYFLFPNQLIGLDFDVNDANNASIVYHTRQFLIISAFYQIFEGVRIALFGALRSLQDTRFSLISSIVGFWVIPFPVGYFLAHYTSLGGVGMWWGMTLGALINMGLLQWRFRRKMLFIQLP